MEKIIKKLKRNRFCKKKVEKVRRAIKSKWYLFHQIDHWRSWKIMSKESCQMLWVKYNTLLLFLINNDSTQVKKLILLSYSNEKVCQTIENSLLVYKKEGNNCVTLNNLQGILNQKSLDAVIEMDDEPYVLWQCALSSLGVLNVLLKN